MNHPSGVKVSSGKLLSILDDWSTHRRLSIPACLSKPQIDLSHAKKGQSAFYISLAASPTGGVAVPHCMDSVSPDNLIGVCTLPGYPPASIKFARRNTDLVKYTRTCAQSDCPLRKIADLVAVRFLEPGMYIGDNWT